MGKAETADDCTVAAALTMCVDLKGCVYRVLLFFLKECVYVSAMGTMNKS